MGRILWVNPVSSDGFDAAVSMLFACSLGHRFSILVGRAFGYEAPPR